MKLIQTIHSYDVFMFNWFMNRKHFELCVRVSRWVSRTGDGFLYPVVAVCLYYVDAPLGRLFFVCALCAFLVERPLYFVLKNGFKRGRPEQALPDFHSFIIPSDRFSFPSGHTSAAFLMASLLGYFFPPLILPLYTWASAVGLSRIFLGVHFPTDVLVGSTMGTTIALISLRMFAA
ncbi:MAG: phosphatase PAP2 family protein [Methylotetracoccus sp.]|jgi:undecaprenyl-diphosphatase|nr:phosphatase PAP2 family protein [Methylotetracoccus sp.]